jgi:sodium transport system ATP-binding protein
VVFSTHIMREAEKLCDRIAIMHRGFILAEGSMAELTEAHQERDLEELFFRLIQNHDDTHAASESSLGGSAQSISP